MEMHDKAGYQPDNLLIFFPFNRFHLYHIPETGNQPRDVVFPEPEGPTKSGQLVGRIFRFSCLTTGSTLLRKIHIFKLDIKVEIFPVSEPSVMMGVLRNASIRSTLNPMWLPSKNMSACISGSHILVPSKEREYTQVNSFPMCEEIGILPE